MAEPRSTAQEASDPSTSPERLLELTERHPQLQRLIVLNPSCPEVALQWILATNPWAKRAYEESRGAVPEAAESVPVGADAAADPVDDEGEGEDEDPEIVSVWGDLGTGTSAAAAAPEQEQEQELPEEAPTPAVRISPTASVVPLGASPTEAAATTPASPAPAPAPAAAAAPELPAGSEYGYAADAPAVGAPAAGASVAGASVAASAAAPGATPAPTAPAAPSDPAEEDGSRTRRRAWFACGGCLVLSLLLVLVLVLVGRAWFGGDEETYQRDSSTTTAQESPAEQPTQQPTEEPTEEETTPDPVSPAPEDAREMSSLHSPTGNISCLLEEDSVSCSVIEHDYGASGAEGCESGPFSITIADGDPARACGSSFLDDSSDVLEYDDSAVRGHMACTSRFDGMTCWNTLTGKGFMVNRATYETF